MAGYTTIGPQPTPALASVIINVAASGDLALVAASSTGLATKLYRIVVVAASATTITFKDGSTGLTGAITLATGVPFVLDYTGEPWFVGTANTAFNLNNSGSVQISGRAYYTLESV